MNPEAKDLKTEGMNRLKIMRKKGNTNGGSCHFVPPFLSGFLKEPDPEEVRKAREAVNEKMKEIGAEPYLMLLSATPAGKMLNVFYVTENARKWESEREDIRSTLTYKGTDFHEMYGYAFNADDQEESGFCYMSLSPDWCRRIA